MGASTNIQYGPTGKPGQPSNVTYKDEPTAGKFADKKIKEKINKGYKEVSSNKEEQVPASNAASLPSDKATQKTGPMEDGEIVRSKALARILSLHRVAAACSLAPVPDGNSKRPTLPCAPASTFKKFGAALWKRNALSMLPHPSQPTDQAYLLPVLCWPTSTTRESMGLPFPTGNGG
jgi:predicted DNA-binding WGR domain protein